jgi:hypothetical protein
MTIKQFLSCCYCLVAASGYAADLQVTLRIMDDFGKPVAGVRAGIGIFQRWKPGDGFGEDIYKDVNGVTDSHGLVVLKGAGRRDEISYGVDRVEGYYYSRGGDYQFRTNVTGRWQPWNPTIDIVLRPILNPVPMYARKFEQRIKFTSSPRSYDLMIGDWVTPDGKGTNADLIFQVAGYWNGPFDHDATLSLSFARPQDGIQEFAPPRLKSSDFRSPREAPISGYQPQISWHRARKPGQPRKEQIDEPAAKRSYFFRIRTTLDSNGNIASALYGKVYDGFDFFGPPTNCLFTSGSCFLNPEPNSRNMEFDPKRNLAKGLKLLEEVREP